MSAPRMDPVRIGGWELNEYSEQLWLENNLVQFTAKPYEGTVQLDVKSDGMFFDSHEIPILALKKFIARWEEVNGEIK